MIPKIKFFEALHAKPDRRYELYNSQLKLPARIYSDLTETRDTSKIKALQTIFIRNCDRLKKIRAALVNFVIEYSKHDMDLTLGLTLYEMFDQVQQFPDNM